MSGHPRDGVGPAAIGPTGTSQARAIGAPIKAGTILEDGTTIGEYIGRSEGALNFYGENQNVGRVVVKILAPQLDEPLAAFGDTITSLYGVRHPSLQQMVGRGRVGPRTFLTYEYVDGQTLRSALQQVIEAGGAVDAPTTAHFVVQASLALDALHAVAPHGVLTSENLYLQRDGTLKVVNVGFANLMLCAFGSSGEQFGNSAYLAPEVREDPWSATELSDVYSLGVLAVALLTGRHPTRTELPEFARIAAARYPDLAEAIEASIAAEPVLRLQSMAEFREAVQAAVPEVGTALPTSDQPTADGTLDELFGDIELPDAPSLGSTDTTANDPERWITHIDGRDFGPYNGAGIKDLLTDDRIDENTQIVDLFTQEAGPLIDIPEFTDFVMEYLPVRAKRKIAQEEKRERTVKTAKRTGGLTAVTGTLAAVSLMILLYVTQVDSPAVPIGDMFVAFPHRFELQEPTYVEIQADEELIASLFDFSDPPPEEPSSSRSGRNSRSERSDSSEREDEPPPSLDDYVLDFDNSRPARKLTNEEINGTIAANQSSVQRCFQRELRANPDFEGVTVRWSIIPDGRTTDIRVEEHGEVTDEVKACLRRAFRHMRFPEFNDVPMTISIPFLLQ